MWKNNCEEGKRDMSVDDKHLALHSKTNNNSRKYQSQMMDTKKIQNNSNKIIFSIDLID